MSQRTEAKSAGLKTYRTGMLCRNGHLSDRLTSNGSCIACRQSDKERKQRKEYRQNPLSNYKAGKQKYIRSLAGVKSKMLRSAKMRAHARNMEFSLSLADIEIPTKCPILGIELQSAHGKRGGQFNSPTIDRIDNEKGYIKGNIAVISSKANSVKSNLSLQQLRDFAINILIYIGKLA